MNGLKVFFEDETVYNIDNPENVFDISVYHEILGMNSINFQKRYTITPPSLLLNNIINEKFEGKRIIKVEWYRDNVFLASIMGNIQTTYNVNTPEGQIEERLMFLQLPSL